MNNAALTKHDFFFCYNKKLSDHIHTKGIDYIVTGINPRTQSMYSMYLKSDELTKAINEYKAQQ